MGVCLNYTTTLTLIDEISKRHTVPLLRWISDDILFKFWGDNVDKKVFVMFIVITMENSSTCTASWWDEAELLRLI